MTKQDPPQTKDDVRRDSTSAPGNNSWQTYSSPEDNDSKGIKHTSVGDEGGVGEPDRVSSHFPQRFRNLACGNVQAHLRNCLQIQKAESCQLLQSVLDFEEGDGNRYLGKTS
jgi:hypothetical protein